MSIDDQTIKEIVQSEQVVSSIERALEIGSADFLVYATREGNVFVSDVVDDRNRSDALTHQIFIDRQGQGQSVEALERGGLDETRMSAQYAQENVAACVDACSEELRKHVMYGDGIVMLMKLERSNVTLEQEMRATSAQRESRQKYMEEEFGISAEESAMIASKITRKQLFGPVLQRQYACLNELKGKGYESQLMMVTGTQQQERERQFPLSITEQIVPAISDAERFFSVMLEVDHLENEIFFNDMVPYLAKALSANERLTRAVSKLLVVVHENAYAQRKGLLNMPERTFTFDSELEDMVG